MNKIRTILMGLVLLCAVSLAQAAEVTRTLVRDGEGTVPQPTRVLLTGDSLMAGMGPQLKRALAGYENLTLIPIGKGSTGLARPDFYNWPKVLEENMIAHKPHIVVMWIGTNDTQNIYNMPEAGAPLSLTWKRAYYQKLTEIFRIVRKHNATLIMMSPPVMSKQPFDNNLHAITNLMAQTCRYKGIYFLNMRRTLADGNGKYLHRTTMQDGKVANIRTPDRIHITSDGNILVMDHLLPCLSACLPGNKLQRRVASKTRSYYNNRGSVGIRGNASTPHSPRAFR
ncbi:MAG: DUF459 domain-containing protein [Akkermansia sp.]|nr:DUF459 domain-containing protein [Akkermansia sp.]